MIVFGLLSSVFDILTFLTLRLGFHASAALSRSGWLIESTITELAVMLVLRTNRPLLPSRPGPAVIHAIAAITITLPYSPLAGPLSLTAVPAWILAALAGLTAFYVIANEGPNLAPTDDPITHPASTVALDELIASTPRGPLPSRSTSLAGRLLRQGCRKEQAPALPLQQDRPNQFICRRLGERLIGLGQGSCVKAASREWFAEGRADVQRRGPLGQVPGSWSRSAMITASPSS
jgi:hypothetical protein